MRRTGPDTRARPPSSRLPPPSSLARSAGPWLTCDGAVVIVPWDPGQPHTPLGQVGELQVPGSVRPSWQQREKTPRRTPELEPARPPPTPGHTHGQVPGGRRPPQQGPPPACPGGSAQGPPPSLRGSRENQEETPVPPPSPRVSKDAGHRERRTGQPIPAGILECKHLAMLFTGRVFTCKKAREEGSVAIVSFSQDYYFLLCTPRR